MKGQADVKLTVRRTRHGPVLSDAQASHSEVLDTAKHVLALRWTALDADNSNVLAGVLSNQAQSVGDLIEAGRLTMVVVDGIDWQSWTNKEAPPEHRARRHTDYYRFFETYFGPRSEATDRNMAWFAQHLTETAIAHQIAYLESRSRYDQLFIEGGVALNCVNNSKVLRESRFVEAAIVIGCSPVRHK